MHVMPPGPHWYTRPSLQPFRPSPQKRPCLWPEQSHDDFLQARWCERDNGDTHGFKRSRVQRLVDRVGGAEGDELVAGELTLADGHGRGGDSGSEAKEDSELRERWTDRESTCMAIRVGDWNESWGSRSRTTRGRSP